MKKIASCALVAVVVLFFASVGANAQTTGSGIGVGVTSSGPMITAVTPGGAGFVQFNSLTVESVSSVNVPAEIVATAAGMVPAANGASGSANSTYLLCRRFNSPSDAVGITGPCPTPPQLPSSTTASYRIEISATTELMLNDRTPASLSDFAQGDQINVYGYYNTDGSVQAYIVRDTSKPAVTQTMQLDNVTLNSISGTSIPATLTVTQATGAPCYGFTGNTPAAVIACPLGVSSFSANSATANVTALPSLASNWQALRKYVVTVDTRTIILDRNRTPLSLSSLNPGDSLNIYGESNDNGQTITADIIRDLSIPAVAPTASAYTGTVTAVNADGSFVIQTNNGQVLTVQNPVTVGQTVTVRGLLNSSSSTISSVSQIMIGGTIFLPQPASTPAQ